MKKIITFSILIFSLSIYSQIKPKYEYLVAPYISDIEKTELKGKVSTIKEYHYKELKHPYDKNIQNSEPVVTDSIICKFNSNGNITYIASHSLYSQHFPIYSMIEDNYEFNDFGNLIEVKRFNSETRESEIITKIKYLDNAVIKHNLDFNSKDSIILNENGTVNKIFRILRKENKEYKFKYNKKGQLIEKTRPLINNKYKNNDHFTYDINGNLISFINDYENILNTYIYNEFNELIEKYQQRDDSQKLRTVFKVLKDYDENGNWLKAIGRNGFIKRKIEYFE